MDEQSFQGCCQLLVQRSQQLGDGWSWETVQGSASEGYLRKTALRSVVIDCSTVWDQEGNRSSSESAANDIITAGLGEEDEKDEELSVCTACEGSSMVLQYEYHILFSCSYSTPVLYFRAVTLEGRNLSLEEVWSSVHPNFRSRLQHSPLSTITLQEHPLLGQPFFMLHPCKTEELMRPVLQAAQYQHRPVNYVVSWLSVVGPVVGLDVPLHYATEPD